MAEKYGKFPSEAMKLSNFDLSLNLIFARTHWKKDYEEMQKRKRK